MALLCGALLFASAVFRNPHLPPVPIPLTSNGLPKAGPLWSDGERIYFTESIDGGASLVSVSMKGGEVRRIEVPGASTVYLLDACLPGPRFLLRIPERIGGASVWEWVAGQAPRRLFPGDAEGGAAWIGPDTFAAATRSEIQIVKRGRLLRTIHLPGAAALPRWADRLNLLRFVVVDEVAGRRTLWEINSTDGSPHPVPGFPPDVMSGAWSSDGRLFAFSQGRDAGDLWLSRPNAEEGAPSLLLHGPFRYDQPLPSPNGRYVFAIGSQHYAEIARYDPRRDSFIPWLGSRDTAELDFSPDGKSLAYIRYPEQSLWRSRADGSAPVLLTSSPMEADEPHWSSDGSRIAFMGRLNGAQPRIYIIPAAGGSPDVPLTDGPAQGVPTWSSDGSTIVYGDFRLQGETRPMSIHLLDLHSRTTRLLPGSEDLWTPRWSPDGRYIFALTHDSRKLRLYDIRRNRWSDLTATDNIDFPQWTADSRFIYFRNARVINPALPFDRAIFRVHIPSGKTERVVSVNRLPPDGFEWFGITPDGTPLGRQGAQVQNIYSIPTC